MDILFVPHQKILILKSRVASIKVTRKASYIPSDILMLSRHVLPQTLICHKAFLTNFTFMSFWFRVSHPVLPQSCSMPKSHGTKGTDVGFQIFVHILMILKVPRFCKCLFTSWIVTLVDYLGIDKMRA